MHQYALLSVVGLICLFSLVGVALSSDHEKAIGLSISNTHWKAVVIRNKTSAEWITDREGNIEHESFPNINKIIGGNLQSLQQLIDSNLLESNKIFEKNGSLYCKVESETGIEKEMAPEDIYSNILLDVKQTSFEYFNENITKIVLTAPMYITIEQRNLIRKLASKQGLEMFISKDPISMIIANDFFEKKEYNNEEFKILVVDLDKYFLEISLFNNEDGLYIHLGNETIDQFGEEVFYCKLRDLFIEEFKKQNPTLNEVNFVENSRVRELLMKQAEIAIEALANQTLFQVDVPSLYEGGNFTFELSMELFEETTKSLIQDISNSINQLFKTNQYLFEDVEQVIVSAKTAINNLIRKCVIERYFQTANVSIFDDNQERVSQAKTIGAAIQATWIEEDFKFLPLIYTPFSLGVENSENQLVKIIPRGNILPTVKNMTFSNSESFLDSLKFRIFAGGIVNDIEKNVPIGEMSLEGIEMIEKGNAQIQVSFQFDQNYNLKVIVMDLTTKAMNEKVFVIEELVDKYIYSGLDDDPDKDEEIGKLLKSYSSLKLVEHDEL